MTVNFQVRFVWVLAVAGWFTGQCSRRGWNASHAEKL
jgi:hypothetical protein